MGPAQYSIRVNGHLGATVLTGTLDQSALHVLADIEALGLET